MCIVVTLKIVFDVLHFPRVKHPNYPSCERLRAMSKDELISAFCERPSNWGDFEFTPCLTFTKGLRFINMVMTFVLHPLSHYNSITEPCAQFLLSLLEHLTIDFPSHFILSIIDVYRDMTSFPSAITRILCHFFVPFPASDHFHVMCAIDTATVKRGEAQFHLRRSGTTTSSTPLAPSTSAFFTLAGGVTLDVIMVQLQCMDAHLNTLTDELCQVNTHVGHITRRQAEMDGYTMPSTLVASADKSDGSGSADDAEDDDDATASDDEDDGDVISSSADEMST